MLASHLISFGVLFFRYYSGQDLKQASGPKVWLYTMLKIFISAASYYCPFALRVSVRVCSIAVDPMGPQGVTDKMVSEPTLYRTCGRKHKRNVSL